MGHTLSVCLLLNVPKPIVSASNAQTFIGDIYRGMTHRNLKCGYRGCVEVGCFLFFSTNRDFVCPVLYVTEDFFSIFFNANLTSLALVP